MVIDFHTHTFLSDGVLVPAELVRRAIDKGYSAIGITDHVDMATLEMTAPVIIQAAHELSRVLDITVIAGVELTHIPLELFPSVVSQARDLGVELIVAHGETIVEPVVPGTNKAAIEAGVDILAHPGLISDEEITLAKEKNVLLEISGRKGHSLSNGHVFLHAKAAGAAMIVGSDAHAPQDLLTPSFYRQLVLAAGGTEDDYEIIRNNSETLLSTLLSRRQQ